MARPDQTAIRLKCPRCFNQLQAAESQVGTKRRCPRCLHVFVVPSAEEVARRQPKVEPYALREGNEPLGEIDQPHLPLRCPLCRTHLQAREDQIGQEITCPDCHTSVLVERPAAESAVLRSRDKPMQVTGGEGYGLIDDPAASRRPAAEPVYFAIHCPLCGTHMQAREDQVGREMTCHDCKHPMTVPPMPPRRPKIRGPKEVDQSAVYGVHAEDVSVSNDATESLIPVVCPLCKTRLHTTEDQIGQKMVCPDCDRLFVVPPPPKAERVYDPRDQFEGNYDAGMPVAAAPSLDSPSLGRFWSGHGKNRDSVEDAEVRQPSRPPRYPFLSGVFNIPWAPSVRVHFLTLWISGMILMAMLATVVSLVAGPGQGYASIGPWIMGMVLSGLTFVIGAGWFMILSIKCLAILSDTAEGRDAIESWPEGVFLDWFGDSFFVCIAMAVAMLPGVLVGKLMVGVVGSTIWLAVPISAVVLFPIMLLSVLETGSPMMPLSKHVWCSLPRVWWAWGLFYAETTLVVVALGGLVVGLSQVSRWLAVPVLSAALIAMAMIYSRLLGRVAWCYARAVQQDEREAAEAEDQEE